MNNKQEYQKILNAYNKEFKFSDSNLSMREKFKKELLMYLIDKLVSNDKT